MRFRFCVTSWWPACKMAPNELCLLAFTSLSRTPSYNESEQACVTVEYRRRYSVWLQKPGQKMHCSFCLGPLNLSIWGEPAMVLWEHSGGPCEEVHVESTKDSAQIQHQLAGRVNEPPWTWMLQPQSSLQIMQPSCHLDCSLMGDPELEPPYQLDPKFLVHSGKLWEIINNCCCAGH